MKILKSEQKDNVLISWNFSRPNTTETDVNLIRRLDLPVNEFNSIYLEIESTIIEREIIASLRNHVMWAQTSRVQDVFNFEYQFERNEIMESKRAKMLSDSASCGARQDEYRLHLPMLSNTRYSILTSPRQLIYISKNLQRISSYCDTILESILLDSISNIDTYLGSIGYSYFTTISYKVSDWILNEDDFVVSGYSKNGNFTTLSTEIPISLRAQMVRHKSILFIDDLFKKITSKNNDVLNLDLNSKIKFSMTAKDNFMNGIASKRSCWIAHYKIWKPFVDLFDDVRLPCDGCDCCPFDRDAALRIEGKDPNPPCPIHMRFSETQPTMEQVDEMTHMIYKDERPADFWHEQINKLDTEI